mgnify:FL=1
MIIQADSLEWLKNKEDNSIDHIITDPPYLIDFLNKGWDSKDNVASSVDYWKEALRVCKSGSYALVFGHSRTHHRVMTAMEDAGWEIRDCVMWIYGSGFPKSHELGAKIDKAKGLIEHRGKMVKHQRGQENYDKPEGVGKHEPISPEAKEWSGWGENLKPAYEPIIMARKPFKGSLTNNVLTNKTGALNIDACRVGTEVMPAIFTKTVITEMGWKKHAYVSPEAVGRFPANVILDEEAGELLDNQAPKTGNAYKATRKKKTTGGSGNSWTNSGKEEGESNGVYDGLGGASRFFYCSKVSAKERNIGTTNNHPTVKPIELMKWLIKLVSREGQTILDPFTGSGSTGIAAELLGREFIGIEMDADYCEIAEKRINAWKEDNKINLNTIDEL